ncbi:butyrophilin subfamily 3 member A1-like [Engraulis encrasicolus]|uniref:butyrophilin subfamily 3 member A1-like n=1 Tax=Engraulis encrasicolus TaxID=184585 RepID=UPI002FD12E3C
MTLQEVIAVCKQLLLQSKVRKGLAVAPEITQPLQTARTSGLPSLTTLSDKITLDTKTANPFLRISNDQRRLRSYTYEESQILMKTDWFERASEKYDGWLCIRGVQGFSSGQHYWEVDIRGIRDWRIGVMRESAPKRGFAKLNTSSGYWTLRLQLGNLVALTEPATKLNISLPSRVGVCLDMQAGEVTFYAIDKKMRREIYRFKADFSNSEKVYPVFGTVDTKKEMVII